MKEYKIISWSNLKKLKSFPWQGKKTVLTGGCFDIFHYAHYLFLKKAKKEGDYLIVLLESDEFIRKKKNREPIHNQKQRAKILSALSFVDMVILLPYGLRDEDYLQIVKLISPTVIAVSAHDPKIKQKTKQAKAVGGKVKVVIDHLKNFSTTAIIKKLNL